MPAERLDVLAGLFDVGRVGVQSLDEVALVGRKRGGQLAVAAAEMHDSPALAAGVIEDPACEFPFRAASLARRRGGCR